MKFIESQLPEVQQNRYRGASHLEACQGLLAFVDSMLAKWVSRPTEPHGPMSADISAITPYLNGISLEWRMPSNAFDHDPARRWPLRAEILVWRGIERAVQEERSDPLIVYKLNRAEVICRDTNYMTQPLDADEVNALLHDLQDSAQRANEARRASPEPQS